ncbi:phosphotransferase enzyme family protein [Bacillus sp. SD088]|uniref:phosphotransferase enzyme family protein n=1 Tax=Bacillus sp. SD088 TaxID=2782012 RepID=UPI001A973858|nr:phosphotransferase [Bacillus sp. SD088]MBO0992755.1 phosphotransferase [Bacillus sp. SD088]
MIEELIRSYYKVAVIKEVEYLGESDNLTFCIHTVDNNKYVLKCHMGAKSSRFIESELRWLEELKTNTNLKIQTPIRNRDNQFITKINDNKTGAPAYWALQEWVEGEVLDRQPTDPEIKKLARLMVTLHKNSCSWGAPETVERPCYNTENLMISLIQLELLLRLNIITSNDFKILQETTRKIEGVIHSQKKNNDTWGMIHSDIHESNYVFHNGEPSIIDFSSCGFGYYLFDVAETLLHLNPNNRRKFITYYQDERKLAGDYLEVLEAFFIWAIIRNFAFLSKNMDEHNELATMIPFIVENYCRKYLKGEAFL